MARKSKYIHLYQTKQAHDADYSRSSANYIEPWVAYVTATDEVSYNLPHDYSFDYLTTTAREDGTFTFTMEEKLSTACVESVSYSIDNGETWTTANNVDGEAVTLTTPTVSEGGKVLWKGVGVQYCSNTDPYPGSNFGEGYFNSTGEFDASGNIMSMLFGDDFADDVELPSPVTTGYAAGAFSYLFSHIYSAQRNCSIVSAANLILPATTLARYCYYGMFDGCTSLASAPALPATTLANSCYGYMFDGCTSLASAPALPATTLANSCYGYMFYGCTSLASAPALPATTLARYCYQAMFYGCTSLVSAPALPATTLADNCYESMFYDCTSLVSAPALPATTLAGYCYQYMFQGCASLTSAPSLPATTLAGNCYQHMFFSCTSLVSAPALPATTLANYCYDEMFSGCSSLNYIKAMFTTTPSSTYTYDWVNAVAATGTFVKNSAATWNVTGTNGVPSGWTVETASE